MRRSVIVIGHGYTSRLGVIRALGHTDFDVTVIAIGSKQRDAKQDFTPPIDSYSKFVSRLLFCAPDAEELTSLLLDRCVENDQKAILFPCSDFAASAIDLNQERLEKHFLFPHIGHTPGAVVEWMSKIRQKGLASKVGLEVAEGVVIEVTDGKYVLPSGIVYPCFMKPMSSITGGKTGLGRCDTERQLRDSIGLLINRSSSISILVEEYKRIDQEYALMGVSDGKTVHIPGILKISSIASGTHYGVAKRGEIVPISGFERFVELCKSFVVETHFEGIFDIDFYKSRDTFYFCEMNFRYGGSGYAYTGSGVNLPTLAVGVLSGEPVDTSLTVEKEALYVNERMCLDDWYNRFVSTREFIGFMRNRDISFIYNGEDPKPGRMFSRMVLKLGIRRAVKLVYYSLFKAKRH